MLWLTRAARTEGLLAVTVTTGFAICVVIVVGAVRTSVCALGQLLQRRQSWCRRELLDCLPAAIRSCSYSISFARADWRLWSVAVPIVAAMVAVAPCRRS